MVARRLGWHVIQAIDIDQLAAQAYRQNFHHRHQIRTIESIPSDEFTSLAADLWWLSPPCQPFTRRGAGRGWNDARSEALRHIIAMIAFVRPPMVAVENVPEFMASSAARCLRHTLSACGYRFAEHLLCPSQFGIPNRRRRYYLAASQSQLCAMPEPKRQVRTLEEYLDAEATDLLVAPSELAGFEAAVDCIASADAAITSCFTSAYGKSPVRSGSYLRTDEGLRRFSPREILRLLGFPDDFQLPCNLSRRQQWKLVGNSLSLPVVQHFLRRFVS